MSYPPSRISSTIFGTIPDVVRQVGHRDHHHLGRRGRDAGPHRVEHAPAELVPEQLHPRVPWRQLARTTGTVSSPSKS